MKDVERLAIEWLMTEYPANDMTFDELHDDGSERMMDEYYAFIEGYKAAQEWIPVSERLPEIDVLVIGYRYDFNLPTLAKYLGNGCGYKCNDGIDRPFFRVGQHDLNCIVSSITHWMPLPETPTL